MWRKTAESIGRALPQRRNLVLTRATSAPYPEQEVVASLDAALALIGNEELMVIGGGEVYALALPRASRLLLTVVDAESTDADTFFPAVDFCAWRETARVHHLADGRHACAFDFVDYARR